MKRLMTHALVLLIAFAAPVAVQAYPMDGFDYTDCRRLLYTWRKMHGEVAGPPIPSGAQMLMEDVKPRLIVDNPPPLVMDPDAELSKAIRDAIGPESSEYAVSLLDISDPENPVYAEINGDTRRNVAASARWSWGWPGSRPWRISIRTISKPVSG